MTKRELYTAVKNGVINDEVIAKATELLTALDTANAKRADKPSKTQVENAPLYAQVLAILSADEPTLSTAVATALGVSTSKATGLLGNLYKDGKVNKVDVAVKGKGKQKGWLIVAPETPAETE